MKAFIIFLTLFATHLFSQDLFFSEYSEGSSNNKYLEIFNPTSQTINLSNYAIAGVRNSQDDPGQHEVWMDFPSESYIPSRGTYLLANGSADDNILNNADFIADGFSILSFNGDDALALVTGNESSYSIIDLVGRNFTESGYEDPGSGWDVAGINNGTQNHTLVRKSSVTVGNTDWALSSGTSSEDSEWIVYDVNYWDDIGTHTFSGVIISFDRFNVSTSGFANGDGSENNPFASIQAGIDAASTGDTILILAGIYKENIDLSGKSITIRGLNKETTIIDGENSNQLVYVNNTQTIVNIKDLTLHNGSAANGAALFIDNSTVSIENCIITNNNGNNSIIHIDNSDVKIDHTIISNNICTNGANSYGAIVTYDDTELELNFVTIVNNLNSGLFSHESTSNHTIRNSIFYNPNASEEIGRRASGAIMNLFYSLTSSEISGCANSDQYNCEGMIYGNPIFTDIEVGDYSIQSTSPCIDSGSPNSDLDPDGTIADMGVYFFNQAPIYVSPTGSDDNPGTQSSPKATIQAGINASSYVVKMLEGEYVISNNILVPEGISLMLDPGVTLKFDDGIPMYVSGGLIAKGTSNNKIYFTSSSLNPVGGDWGPIQLLGTSVDASFDSDGNYIDGSIFEHVIIEYGLGLKAGTSTELSSTPYITHSTFRYNFDQAIKVITTDGVMKVDNCDFYNNGSANDAFYLLNISPGNVSTEILDNNIYNNISNSILIDVYSGSIHDNNIYNNTCLSWSGIIGNPSNNFYNNIVKNNSGHIIRDAGNIYSNVFYNNTNGDVINFNYGSEGYHIYENLIIANNGGIGAGQLDNGTDIYNNIIAENTGSRMLFFSGEGSGSEVKNNSICWNTTNNGDLIYMANRIYGDIKVTNNTISNNINPSGSAILQEVASFNDYTDFLVSYNNVINDGSANYYRYGNPYQETGYTVNMENNYWSTSVESDIADLIYDWYDDTELGFVDYSPFLIEPNTDAPISPPYNVVMSASSSGVTLSWDVNPESDVAGYKVYYGNPTGYSFASSIDVGNVTEVNLSGLSLYDSIAVTAYDGDIDGFNDQTDGNESWFTHADAILTYYVSNDGDNNNSGFLGNPFASIQVAINASKAKDTVYVYNGSYNENINFNGKNIHLVGESKDSTIISGNNDDRVVSFLNGENNNASISNFTIINGLGGIVVSNSSPRLNNLIIKDNAAPAHGGGINIFNSNVNISHTVITKNSGCCGGGLNIDQSTVSLINCSVVKNLSASGMIINGGSNVTLLNSIIWQNIGDAEIFINEGTISNTLDISYSNISNGQNGIQTNNNVQLNWGSGNSSKNPLFCDLDNNILSLDANSPSLNTSSEGGYIGAYDQGCNKTKWYVSESGSDNNSGSLNNPFKVIQSAINASSSNDTVIVSSGTYFENLIISGKNINLIGQGSASTILDGSEASTVIQINNTQNGTNKILGFKLQNGTGLAGSYSDSYITDEQLMGGGIVSISSDLILKDIVLQNNSAEYGGGIFSHNSNISASSITFNNNDATNGQGGAIWSYVDDGLSKTISIDSSTISQNTSTHRGAGLAFVRGIVELKNTQITNNISPESGGGVYVAQLIDGLIDNCILSGNSASQGGGMFSTGGFNGSNCIIKNSLFFENIANEGSAIKLFVSDIDLINCTIVDNNAGSGFGENSGHIFIHHSPSNLNIVNTIISNDAEFEIIAAYPASSDGQDSITINHSMISGANSFQLSSNTNLSWGDGNIDVDPLFIDQENNNYGLLANSPLINSGNPNTQFQINDMIADIGFFQYNIAENQSKWYVSLDGNISTASGSNSDPFSSIQAAINFASDDDSIFISNGTYVENVKFRSSAVHLLGQDKLNTIIDGNTTGSVISITEPNSGISVIQNLTLKNGSGTQNGWQGVNGPVGGGIFAKYNNVSLKNLIIKENSAIYGGGVFIQTNEGVTADLEIENVNFENNSASGESSAAWIRPTNVTLEIKNSAFENNNGPTAANISGPDLNVKLSNNNFSQNSGHLNLYGSGSSSLFELSNNLFVGNISNQNGGALLLDGSNYSVIIESCIFSDNLANSAGGGGVAMRNGGSVTIRNSLFYNNEALDGGAIMCNIPNTTIYNTTMVNNVDNQFGLDASAILIHTNNESFEMLNSIVWNNKIVLDDYNQGNINIDYSNIYGGLDSILISDNNNGLLSYGINNLNVDPMFIDLNNDNYHLNQYSQLIGAGTLLSQVQSDIEGGFRPFPEGSSPDIGAYEHISGSPYVNFTPTISSISDTTILEDAGNIMRLLYGITDGSQSENDSIFVYATTTDSNVKDLSVNYNYPDNFANISFSFENDSSGLAEIFIVVKDDGGTLNDAIDSALTSFTLNVLPVNDAPVITAISDTSFYEDDSLVIALSAFDVDNDSLLFYESYDQNYVSIIGDTLILNAAENWNGQFLSYIHVSDGDLYDSTDFMVDIIPVNDAPTIAELNDTNMLEDGFLKLEFNSYDVDGDTLNYEAWSDRDFGQIQIDLSGNSSDYEHDSLLITPHPNWFGSAEIYVRVLDNALSDTMNFTLEVESVDDLPITDMPFADVTLYEDSPDTTLGNLDSLFTDIDGELEFSVSIGDTNLIDVTIYDNLALMHITPNAFGSTDIIFIATNPTRAMVKDTVMVEILPINDPPTIDTIADTTILEDSGQLIINLTGISSGAFNEYQDLIISATFSDSTILGNIGPHNFYYNSPDSVGTVELFTNINVFGSTDVIIEVHDNAGDSARTQFTVDVEPVNDAPQLETISLQTINEDSLASVKIVASDIEDDYLTFSAISDTSGVETFMYGDSLVLVSLPDWNGEANITVTASDGELIDTTYFSLHVIPVDDEPVITFNILDLLLEEDFSDTVLAHLDTVFNDIDGSLTYSYNISDTSVFSANINSDGILEINANQNAFGEAQLVIIASNQTRASVADTIEVIVASVNDTPEFVSELNALVGVGIEFYEEIDTYDADMDQLTLSFNNQEVVPDWLTLDGNIISGVPSINGDFPILLDLSDNDTTITDTFHLSAEVFHPVITSIIDVPEDQGGWVYLGFSASYLDSGEETGQEYGVYRYDTYEDTSAWVMVTSGPAIYQDHYVFEVHTSGDSTSEDNGMAIYKVVASMNEGVFHSPPDSGYSLDNIAPGVPTGIQAIALENSISLSWDISEAEDFQYFVLERSNEAVNGITDTTISYELVDTNYEDLNFVRNVEYSYKLAAYDYAGNRSEYTEPVLAILLSIDPSSLIPDAFALHQNYPNPFNPTTQIRYDLPDNEFVSIYIYDVMGRKIKSLVNVHQEAGYRSITWNATNNLGQPVSAGMYIYTIQAGEFRQTKKMLLLK